MKSVKSKKSKDWKELPIVSFVLVAINLLVFVICMIKGEDLFTWGHIDVDHVLIQQEYGRLIGALFYHVNYLHLFCNIFVLILLGMMIEKAVGHIRFAFFYFFSGICGYLLSLYFMMITEVKNVVYFGADGAIFGLEGVVLALALLWADKLGNVGFVKALLLVAYSAYSGLIMQYSDNAANVGGLMTGFLWAVVMCMVEKRRKVGGEKP